MRQTEKLLLSDRTATTAGKAMVARAVRMALPLMLALAGVGCGATIDRVTDATTCSDFVKAERDAQMAYAGRARDSFNRDRQLRDPLVPIDLVRQAFVAICRIDMPHGMRLGSLRRNPLLVPLYVADPKGFDLSPETAAP